MRDLSFFNIFLFVFTQKSGGINMKKFLTMFIITFLVFSCNKRSETAAKNEKITVDGAEVTIINKRIKPGDKLADAELTAPVDKFNKMKKVKLSDDKGIKLIYTAPSLDTPVCSLQTKMLEEKAKEHTEVFFYSITDDLPFAMERFCSSNNITNLKTLSDFQNHEFSTKNGFLMEEYQLMTRAVIIVDENGIVKYVDYAKEVTDELELEKALEFLEKEMLKR